MKMYEWWIGLRYLLSHRKERFISLISVIAMLGVATGVAALLIVIGVMSGFDRELRDRIIGVNSHLVVEKIGGMDDPAAVEQQLAALPAVVASAPYVNTQALLVENSRQFPVMVRGIDPQRESQVTDIRRLLKSGDLQLADNGIIIGSELANRLLVNLGDTVELVSLEQRRGERFVVRGFFTSGMYDFDSSAVFIALAPAQKLAGMPGIVNGIAVRIHDVLQAGRVKASIQSRLGLPYFTRTWMDLNRTLFDALKLEKTAMFVILTLIVLVASMNIISTLIMLVMEKTKDIGILQTIGVPRAGIQRIFTIVGTAIGVVGTGLGAAAGMAMAYCLKTYEFIRLPQEIYYIDRLPVEIDRLDVLLIVLAALVISLLATLYPSWQASRLNTVEALRYE